MPPPDDHQARLDEFIGRYGLLTEQRGGPGMAGRILAFLLVSEEPIQSSSDIAEAVQTSSGSVSIHTRLLEQAGLIERVAVPGRRGAFFRVKPGAWRAIFDRVVDDTVAIKRMFEDVVEALPGQRGERVREALDFYSFLEETIPRVIERWHARNRGEE